MVTVAVVAVEAVMGAAAAVAAATSSSRSRCCGRRTNRRHCRTRGVGTAPATTTEAMTTPVTTAASRCDDGVRQVFLLLHAASAPSARSQFSLEPPMVFNPQADRESTKCCFTASVERNTIFIGTHSDQPAENIEPQKFVR